MYYMFLKIYRYRIKFTVVAADPVTCQTNGTGSRLAIVYSFLYVLLRSNGMFLVTFLDSCFYFDCYLLYLRNKEGTCTVNAVDVDGLFEDISSCKYNQ